MRAILPRVNNPRKLDLSSETEAILMAMFPGHQEVVLREDYTSLGYSGSWVYCLHLLKEDGVPELPAVVKIAPAGLVEREVQAYEKCVRNQWPGIAELRGPPVFLPGNDLAGLCYSLLGGGVFRMQSLREYCLAAAAEDIAFVLRERLFRVMLERMLRPARNVFEFPLRASYDAILPVNLLVDASLQRAGVTPISVTPHALPRSPPPPGTSVRLEGFAVAETDPRQHTVTLNLAPTGPPNAYRVRLRSVEDLRVYPLDSVMPPTEGTVAETRWGRLSSEVASVLSPSSDPAEETVTLCDATESPPIVLPNPLLAIHDILCEMRHIKVHSIHGDLNLENVLVDAQVRDVRLIDFAEAREDHVLHDFLRLETEVVTKLLPVALGKAGLSVHTIPPFYERLHCATFELDSRRLGLALDASLEVPFAMLCEIRRAAREGLYDRNDWREYYQCLIIYLVSALKYANLDQIPQAKRIAFWAAATAQHLLHAESPCHKYLPSYRADLSCPYRGLFAFGEEHAALFFGRESLIRQSLDRLRTILESGQEYRLLAIIGPSGSGKSSLAQAGLVAALRRGELAGSHSWRVTILRPGGDPLESLGAALCRARVIELSDCDELCRNMMQSERTLHRVTYDASPERRLVLLVDQFEEVFTLCGEDAQRRAFIDNLVYASGAAGGQALVLLTLRADFYGECIAYKLAEVLPTHQVLVKPMTEDELGRAIQQPAYAAGRAFEAGLVDRLLEDVRGQPGGLPLLQHALLELWNRCPDQMLTHRAYAEIGGVSNALERRAEAAYAVLLPDERSLCQRIFLRLIQPGRDADTGRRATYKELSGVEAELPVVESVVHRLADARLLTTEGDEGHRYVQIAHEALIQGWRRLRTWIDEHRESLRLYHPLAEAARDWAENDRDPSYLYWGLRLAQVEAWAAEYAQGLSDLERDFLAASRAAHQERQQRRALTESRRLAKCASERIDQDRDLALLLAIEARRAADTPEADAALRNALLQSYVPVLVGHDGAVRQVAWNEAGTRIATAGADGTARVWEAGSGSLLMTLTGHMGPVHSVAWDRSGTRLATASEDGTARVWDEESGASLAVLAGHRGPVYGATWSPDGTRILTVAGDGTARVWDGSTGRELIALLASGRRGRPPDLRARQPDPVEHGTWNSDGSRVLTACADGTARVWDVERGAQLLVLCHRTGAAVYHAEWDPGADRIVTAGGDHKARVWDAERGTELVVLSGHGGWVYRATWSPNGACILTASVDGTARIWDAVTGAQLVVLAGHLVVRHSAWNRAGTRIVTAGDDGTARIWDGTTGEELTVLRGHADSVRHAVWNKTGRQIATVSDDGTARVWDLGGSRQPAVEISRSSAQDLLAFACQRATRNLSHTEWQEHMGGEPYRETCPGKPIPGMR